MISDQEAREAVAGSGKVVFVGAPGLHTLMQWALQELARRDWQDEPTEPGWYWLEQTPASRGPTRVYLRDGKWYFDGDFRQYPVTGRVYKVIGRPT